MKNLIEKFRDPYNRNTDADAKQSALIALDMVVNALCDVHESEEPWETLCDKIEHYQSLKKELDELQSI